MFDNFFMRIMLYMETREYY